MLWGQEESPGIIGRTWGGRVTWLLWRQEVKPGCYGDRRSHLDVRGDRRGGEVHLVAMATVLIVSRLLW